MHKSADEGFRVSRQQGRLWRLIQTDGELAYRAQSATLIKGALDESILQTSLSDAVRRHEILRTTFRRPPGRSVPVQVIADPPTVLLDRIDLTQRDPSQQCAAIDLLFEELKRVPFDLEKGPLLIARL